MPINDWMWDHPEHPRTVLPACSSSHSFLGPLLGPPIDLDIHWNGTPNESAHSWHSSVYLCTVSRYAPSNQVLQLSTFRSIKWRGLDIQQRKDGYHGNSLKSVVDCISGPNDRWKISAGYCTCPFTAKNYENITPSHTIHSSVYPTSDLNGPHNSTRMY